MALRLGALAVAGLAASGQPVGGEFSQYLDYQKYMQGTGAGGSGGAAKFQQYMDYQKYMQGQGAGSSASGAADQKANIEQYIPQAYRHFAEAPIDKEYEKNLDRLTDKIPPPSSPAFFEKDEKEHNVDTHDTKNEDATVPQHGDRQKSQKGKKAEREEQTMAAKSERMGENNKKPEASERHGDKIEKAAKRGQRDRKEKKDVSERGEKNEVDHESKDSDHDTQAPPADVRLATSGFSIGFTSRLARVMWVLPVAVAGAFAAAALSRRGRSDRDDEPMSTPFLSLDTMA